MRRRLFLCPPCTVLFCIIPHAAQLRINKGICDTTTPHNNAKPSPCLRDCVSAWRLCSTFTHKAKHAPGASSSVRCTVLLRVRAWQLRVACQVVEPVLHMSTRHMSTRHMHYDYFIRLMRRTGDTHKRNGDKNRISVKLGQIIMFP